MRSNNKYTLPVFGERLVCQKFPFKVSSQCFIMQQFIESISDFCGLYICRETKGKSTSMTHHALLIDHTQRQYISNAYINFIN